MCIVENLLDFLETGNREQLLVDDKIGSDTLRVISIEVLSWLKLEYKRSVWMKQGRKTCHKALEVYKDVEWCDALVGLIHEKNVFSQVFRVTEKGVEFGDTFTEEDKESIRKLAFENYNPPICIN